MLQLETKTFQELTISELYEILQLRSEVFVVEQEWVQELKEKYEVNLNQEVVDSLYK